MSGNCEVVGGQGRGKRKMPARTGLVGNASNEWENGLAGLNRHIPSAHVCDVGGTER